jgi:hypothetical protein
MLSPLKTEIIVELAPGDAESAGAFRSANVYAKPCVFNFTRVNLIRKSSEREKIAIVKLS